MIKREAGQDEARPSEGATGRRVSRVQGTL